MYFKHIFCLWFVLVNQSLGTGKLIPGDQISFSKVSHETLEDTREALVQAHIINDTLDDFLPSCYLHVFYASTAKEVRLGNTIKPSRTKQPPAIRIVCPEPVTWSTENGFTIALTDPDAPSRKNPKWSEMCHWIITVPGGDNTVNQMQPIKEVLTYKPPGPPPKTGYHRYVFVLMHGDNTNLTVPSDRQHWGTGKERHGVRDWAKSEGLEVVGGNFFYARNKNW